MFPNRQKYYALLALGFGVQLLLMMALGTGSMWLLSAVRAYVAGEGAWSKAQKDAVLHLRLYGETGDPSELKQFREYIAIPRADHEARLELEKRHPDLKVAGAAFIRAQNHPDDVLGMCLLVRWFSREGHLRQAIEFWREGDVYVGRLQQAADALEQVMANPSDRNRRRDLLSEIDRIHLALTPVEDGFSTTLGAGARAAQTFVTTVIVAGTVLLFVFGLLVARTLMNRLRQSEEQYRKFLDTAGDAIFICEPRTKAILDANETGRARTGMTRQALIGKRLDDLLTETSSGDLLLTNGTIVDVKSTIARVGQTEILVSIVRDITEQRTFQRRSEEAARMESIGRLADVIAHDFRTQLAAIMVYASDMKSEARSSQLVRAFDQILRSARNGADLVDSLMAFSRGEPRRLELVDLEDVVLDALHFLRRLIGENVELAGDPWGCPLPVMAEPSQLKQVLVNLATNARDAMPNGGLVTFHTYFVQAGEALSNWKGRAPKVPSAMLVVEDSGQGMDEHTREHAFDPFFTTKNAGKGAGLGLWSVFLAMRQFNGDVWIDSMPGRGTKVHLLLPVAKEALAFEPGSNEKRTEVVTIR
jgi:signal transduction histidine kinase